MGYAILVAEDDFISRTMIESILRKDGHILHVCDDGEKAFKILLANAKMYDLIITDISMPKMDGTELARIIKVQMNITTPILAVTSYDKSMFRPELVVHFDGWLVKPMNSKNLRDEVNRILSSKSEGTIRINAKEK